MTASRVAPGRGRRLDRDFSSSVAAAFAAAVILSPASVASMAVRAPFMASGNLLSKTRSRNS
jgi:hypothetical protein